MSPDKLKGDKQRHFRWRVWGHEGHIAPNHRVSLINFSQSGALIEHSHRVQPETSLTMTILVHEQELGIKCRVVRSSVHRAEALPTGEQAPIYRTALEFLSPPETSQRLIDEFIDRLRGER